MTRILYLDDEDALVLLMTRMLKALGYHAFGHTTASAALTAFRSEPERFDLVITDLSMPGMSGLDFARQILAIRPQARVAIATGHVDPRDIEAARSAGVLRVIAKPDSIDELSRIVTALLAQTSAATQAGK